MGKMSGAHRREAGLSLPEILLAAVLSSVIFMVFGELAVLLTVSSISTWNKTEGLSAARFALARIERDVRHARAFGDIYGSAQDRLTFPAPSNPMYSAPPTLPPSWKAMTLSDTVLVIQTPVFYEGTDPSVPQIFKGAPVLFDSGSAKYENVMTTVYQIIPDTLPDQYALQVATFSGQVNFPSTIKYLNPPQTILRGIIGPSKNTIQLPSVFSYLVRTNTASGFAKTSTPSSQDADYIRGVVLDFEIKRTPKSTSATSTDQYPSILSLHSEAFARSNYQMTLQNR